MDKTNSNKVKINSYTDLIMWQKSHELTLKIYEIVKKFPNDEKFNIISQIRRSALSIPTNIVEGFSRWNTNDSLRFYNISDSSLTELNYLVYLSRDLGYIKKADFDNLNEKMEECTKLIRSWLRSMRNRNTKKESKQ